MPHVPAIDARPFVDPDLVTATTVDDILDILHRDVGEGDPLTIASHINALWGGRKWTLDVVGRVDHAVHAALPSAAQFAHWPARAQSIVLTTERVFVPVTTSQAPNADDVVATLLGSMPGFTLKETRSNALGYNGNVYGLEVDVVMTNANGDQFTSHEYFDRAGNYLGSMGGDFDDVD